ncbi:hypothetical protein PROSTU_04277 [Providencia stuartii ATCC 25827]|uniref:Uncharacterized protein n=1 Tax=Providencia stuartii ATCC 25827 TaxID=471874 RepID=A0AA87CPC7_PROST|nr:hypothetical protein PROSTU_04277 [Providencia stuartii ATCC 25827]
MSVLTISRLKNKLSAAYKIAAINLLYKLTRSSAFICSGNTVKTHVEQNVRQNRRHNKRNQ